LRRVEYRHGLRAAMGVAYGISVAALVPSLLDTARHDRHPIARIEREARAVDAELGGPLDWSRLGSFREVGVYYGMARELDFER
jgi:hypothetical protein